MEKWGASMVYWTVGQRMLYPDTNLFSKRGPQRGVVCCLRLSEGSNPGPQSKERSLTKVWLTSVLFQLINGDKGLS